MCDLKAAPGIFLNPEESDLASYGVKADMASSDSSSSLSSSPVRPTDTKSIDSDAIARAAPSAATSVPPCRTHCLRASISLSPKLPEPHILGRIITSYSLKSTDPRRHDRIRLIPYSTL